MTFLFPGWILIPTYFPISSLLLPRTLPRYIVLPGTAALLYQPFEPTLLSPAILQLLEVHPRGQSHRPSQLTSLFFGSPHHRRRSPVRSVTCTKAQMHHTIQWHRRFLSPRELSLDPLDMVPSESLCQMRVDSFLHVFPQLSTAFSPFY